MQPDFLNLGMIFVFGIFCISLSFMGCAPNFAVPPVKEAQIYIQVYDEETYFPSIYSVNPTTFATEKIIQLPLIYEHEPNRLEASFEHGNLMAILPDQSLLMNLPRVEYEIGKDTEASGYDYLKINPDGTVYNLFPTASSNIYFYQMSSNARAAIGIDMDTYEYGEAVQFYTYNLSPSGFELVSAIPYGCEPEYQSTSALHPQGDLYACEIEDDDKIKVYSLTGEQRYSLSLGDIWLFELKWASEGQVLVFEGFGNEGREFHRYDFDSGAESIFSWRVTDWVISCDGWTLYAFDSNTHDLLTYKIKENQHFRNAISLKQGMITKAMFGPCPN